MTLPRRSLLAAVAGASAAASALSQPVTPLGGSGEHGGALNLRGFGAKGDGASDDSKAIAAWASALKKAKAQGSGARGYAPAGVYMFRGVVDVPACVIEGAGEWTTVFKAADSSAQLLCSVPPGVDDSQGANAAWRHFTVDGGHVATGSLVKFGVQNFVTWDSISVRDSLGVGLELAGTQNSIFTACVFKGHAKANIVLSDGPYGAQRDIYGADGNLFLKCEISTYGVYAIDSQGHSFNNTFEECGVEYSTSASEAAVRVNNRDGQGNTLCVRGGFMTVHHGIPVFSLIRGTLNFDGGQCYGGGAAGSTLFRLDGTGLLLKLAGNCVFNGATNLFLARQAGAVVYDLANYFNACTHLYASDAGVPQDAVLTRPMPSSLLLRTGRVQFPATANPSPDANTLDDYREGQFMPAIHCGGSGQGVSMSKANGTFVKVGRLVFVTVDVAASIARPPSGDVSIAGLPFPASASSALAPGAFSGLPAGSVISAQVQPGQPGAISLFSPNAGSPQAGNAVLKGANLSGSVAFTLSGCYLAAA